MRTFQVLIALAAVFLSPFVGLIAPAIAFFVIASGLSGLSATSWRWSPVATMLLTTVQVAALAGSVLIAIQSTDSDAPAPDLSPTAQTPAGPGSIPASDRASP